MTFLIIGAFVGFIMGLTGAGGALVSIPLFVYLADASLKEATVMSLVVVFVGAAINLASSHAKSDKKVAIGFLVFATVTNYLSVSLKAMISDFTIMGLLTAIAIYSLWSVWSAVKVSSNSSLDKSSDDAPLWKLAFAGAILGLATTLTGLGGGVLLVPILMGLFGKSYAQAVPTSLLSIVFVSLTSLFFQRQVILSQIDWTELGLMTAGLIVSAMALRALIPKISLDHLEISRKLIFSAVVVYAIASLSIKTL